MSERAAQASGKSRKKPGWKSIARVIDHTLLRPEATRSQVVRLCQEALHFHFASACLHPCWVALAESLLRGSGVKVSTAIGFPHGASLSSAKHFEAVAALRRGANELDMVINIGALKSGEYSLVENEIRRIAKAAHKRGAIVKAILEVFLLSREEKITACELAVNAEADFVKTSTGFAAGGATVEDVRLLRSLVGRRVGVKASGGIRTASQVAAMLDAGANRIGTNSAVNIMRELGAPELPG